MSLKLSWSRAIGIFLFFLDYIAVSIGAMSSSYLSPGQVLFFIVVFFVLFIAAAVLVLCD